MQRVRSALVGALACLAALPGCTDGTAGTQPSAYVPSVFPHPGRVAVMVLENRSYGQVIGNRKAPYLNRLARRHALATRYYAITHPSLPNYIALTTGAMAEISTNCAGCATDLPSLVNQLDAAGISWNAYFESIPPDADIAVTPTGSYDKHYNPFIYTESVDGRRIDRSKVVDFRRLRRDLRRGHLPRFSWIAPNVHHDGHEHSLRAADAYAARTVPRVLHALGPDGVLYLTWDEGRRSDRTGVGGSPGGGHVALIAAGGAARRHTRTAIPANHYALLRTIEANFGLPPLGSAGASSTPLLSGLLRPASPRARS
jgi:phosphatidylinositol-3-phosphatase